MFIDSNIKDEYSHSMLSKVILLTIFLLNLILVENPYLVRNVQDNDELHSASVEDNQSQTESYAEEAHEDCPRHEECHCSHFHDYLSISTFTLITLSRKYQIEFLFSQASPLTNHFEISKPPPRLTLTA